MDQLLALPGLGYLIGAARFIIMLSVLIFVHELGHFVVAKLCGIYVATFSIGFGRRLFGFKWRETDYRISVVPLGGYVKMIGQSDMPEQPGEELDPDEVACPDHMRFDAKPVWQRIAVSAAGPAVSLGFGIVVYWFMYMTGVPMPRGMADTKIGYVEPESPAQVAGIQTGDRIVTIDGYAPKDWEDLHLTIIGVGEHPVTMEVENPEGLVRTVQVTPELAEGQNLVAIGVTFYEEYTVEDVLPGEAAARAGLREGDTIVGLRAPDGVLLPATRLQDLVREHIAEPITFELMRAGERLALPVTPERAVTIHGLETDGTTVLAVNAQGWPDVPRRQLPRSGDRVIAINGRPIAEDDAMMILSALGEDAGARVPVQFERDGRAWTLLLTTEARGIIGIRYSTDMEVYQYGALEAVPHAVERFATTIYQTVATIRFLLKGSVSTKELAGPLGIMMISEQVARVGWPYYLSLVGMITINLGILNILPIPVLDGGNVMILLIEGIRRRPLSDKAMYYVQHVGLVFLVFLMVFVTFNDIRRGIEAIFG